MSTTARVPVSRQYRGSPHRTTIDRCTIHIRLYDGAHEALPNAWYLIRTGEDRHTGRADGEGWVERRVWVIDDFYRVCWSPQEEPPGEQAAEEEAYRYSMDVYLCIDDDHRDEAARQRLSNLGFPYEAHDQEGRQESVAAFQSAFAHRGLEPTGELDDQTFNVLKDVHDNCELQADEARE